jgi:hypothetical protein
MPTIEERNYVQKMCSKIKDLSDSGMNTIEVEKIVHSLNLPLGAHLAILNDLRFVMAKGRLKTKQDIRFEKVCL